MHKLNEIKYSQIVRYKKINGNFMNILIGLQINPGYYYPFISYNNFSSKEVRIPKGYRKYHLDIKSIKKYYFDNNKKLLTKNNEMYKKIKSQYKGYKKYLTHDNGGRSFLVYVNNTIKKVHIFKFPEDKYYLGENIFKFPEDKYYLGENKFYAIYSFIKKIAEYKVIDIFIGKSPLNPMTEFSGGHGKAFDGNSILLKINKDKYVYIGESIYEFKTNDNIIKYYSPVGNNDVPYPFAIGEKYVYFMLDQVYLPKNIYDECVPKNCTDAYTYFYSHKENCNMQNYQKKMSNLKIIHKRIEW
ncbi:hypothetical protein Hokovirus_2_45 [Hokovirus HKV1]|uniref:Uncharacterized protein n=1 Tax=Hokovirus HKV1 TaxID=1977638 RepID=A0A1V0SFW2_9VIRU|nr:hypothetical protein Hokovirus_2_45 [Hokovirus HKV1]